MSTTQASPSFLTAVRNKISPHLTWLNLVVLAVLCFAIFARVYNFENSLYFIYDQGRDAWKLREMAGGDLTLIGPTSGLPGFFLGPLWYYVGLPGYVLFAGSPYGIGVWYILIASLALPIYWLIAKKLFPEQSMWQLALLLLLSFICGSIEGTLIIWNPLISLPLMAAAWWSMLHARESRLQLFLAFLMLGFVLHSEFAYAVFVLPVWYVLIFWIRQRFSVVDYLVAGFAVGITLLPQIAFEIKNNFIMMQSLLSGTVSSTASIPLTEVWLRRPVQLFYGTRDLLFSGKDGTSVLLAIALMLAGVAIYRTWKKSDQYVWKVTALFALIPYAGFMFWTGNYGNFFSYYITPHFMFIVALVLLGARELFSLDAFVSLSNAVRSQARTVLATAVTVAFLAISWNTISDLVFWPKNNAGMNTVDTAIQQVMEWELGDRATVGGRAEFSTTTTTFTPNFLTAQYDYFLHWRSEKLDRAVPYTQARSEDAIVYAIMEPDREIPEVRFVPWYENVQNGRVLIRRKRIGVLLLETWIKEEFALAYGLPASYVPTIEEAMGW